MTPVHGLFEAHLNVRDLQRSIKFFEGTLGLKLAAAFPARCAAFFWVGEPGGAMVGLWETGVGPQRATMHVAFSVALADLLDSPARLRAAGVVPLDFWEAPTEEPVVHSWMPAASVYFHDPDGNLIEYITMLPGPACPERGTVRWSEWIGTRGPQAAEELDKPC